MNPYRSSDAFRSSPLWGREGTRGLSWEMTQPQSHSWWQKPRSPLLLTPAPPTPAPKYTSRNTRPMSSPSAPWCAPFYVCEVTVYWSQGGCTFFLHSYIHRFRKINTHFPLFPLRKEKRAFTGSGSVRTDCKAPAPWAEEAREALGRPGKVLLHGHGLKQSKSSRASGLASRWWEQDVTTAFPHIGAPSPLSLTSSLRCPLHRQRCSVSFYGNVTALLCLLFNF